MSMGYRVFFIQNDEVHRISQKRFNALHQSKDASFPKFAGQTITSVLVVYELVARKPDHILRMDTQKIRFDQNGLVDQDYENEGMQLVASKIDTLFSDLLGGDENASSGKDEDDQSTLVDASRRFNDRRWNQRHPQLDGPVLQKILDGVFGTSTGT